MSDSLNHWLDIEEDFWKQKVKDETTQLDDRNTTYFHNKSSFRKRRTQIDSSHNKFGIWLSYMTDIVNESLDHFSSMSKSTNHISTDSHLNCVQSCISMMKMLCLWQFLLLKRLSKLFLPCNHGQHQDQMVSLLVSIRKCGQLWVLMLSRWFRTFSTLDSCSNKLIPKSCPKNVDFIPISLCNVAYKIIS